MPLVHSSNFDLTVPYGHISGKIWTGGERPDLTNTETVRILALHGWQDNCGSFDALLPNFPDHYFVVAIDLPGHGFSSHLPAGSPYNDIIFVVEVERIVQSLGWKDRPFTILGHSMGAAIGLFYACLYPKSVQRIVALDMIKPLTFPAAKLAAKTREGIEQFLQLEAKSIPTIVDCASHQTKTKSNGTSVDEASNNYATNGVDKDNDNGHKTTNGNTETDPFARIPLYDFEQAIEKLISAHSIFGAITPDGARLLLQRGAKQAPNQPDGGSKVYFTRDNRLKAMLFQRMDNDALLHYFEHLTCELLIVQAEKGVKLDPPEVSDRYVALYERRCSRFELARVSGGHHVHLCEPDNVYPTVVKFISGCSGEGSADSSNGHI